MTEYPQHNERHRTGKLGSYLNETDIGEVVYIGTDDGVVDPRGPSSPEGRGNNGMFAVTGEPSCLPCIPPSHSPSPGAFESEAGMVGYLTR